MKGFQHIVVLLILSAVCFLAYSNTFSVPFHFDDLRVIRFNFSLRDLGNWKAIFSSEPFRPLLIATFALNYKLGGGDTFYYHAFNLAGHILAVALFYFFIRRQTEDRFIPVAAACLMALHPLNTEAVTYLSSRAIVFCAVFYFACLLCVDSYFRTKKKIFLPPVIGFFVAAFLMKEDGALIPVAALLYNFLFFGKDSVKRHRLFHVITISFIVIGAGLRVYTHFRLTEHSPYPFVTWVFTEITVWLRYLLLAISPISLNVDPDISTVGLASPMFWVSLLGVAGLLYLFFKIQKTHPFISFWGCWFFLNLMASSSVIPLTDLMAEHRAYISLFGFCACLSYMAFFLWAERSKQIIAARIMIITIVAFYGIATYQRNRVWQSEVTLWHDSIRKSPKKIRPHLNLAGAYFNKKAYDLAIEEYSYVMTLNPSIPECFSGLGISYLRKKDYASAETALQKALELKPELVDPKTGLGILRYNQGRWQEALFFFRQIYPYRRESLQLAQMMSDAHMRLGQYSEAIPILQQAIALYPTRNDLRMKLKAAMERVSLANTVR